jgi:hypothetical protein
MPVSHSHRALMLFFCALGKQLSTVRKPLLPSGVKEEKFSLCCPIAGMPAIGPWLSGGEQTGAGFTSKKLAFSPSGLSIQRHWEWVCIPSPMATVETPAQAGLPTSTPLLSGGVSNRS